MGNARQEYYKKTTERQQTIFASALRGTANSGTIVTPEGYSGVNLILDIPGKAGTSPTLDLKVQAVDSISGEFRDIPGAAFSQHTAEANDELIIRPGIAETANVSVSDAIPAKWRLLGTVGGSSTPTFTYSVSADFIP